MLILILAYLGGVLTIFSPCVLPVVPFVFSRSDQPFRKSGLPMLVGMGLSFAVFGLISVAGGNWAIKANQFGRVFALVIFSILGLTLLFPKFAEKIMNPFVKLGNRLQQKAETGSGLGSSLLLGASIGLLWAPCAGPILGLVLAGAAISGSTPRTFALLLLFAAGAASSLAVAILAGGKLLRTLKKGLGAEEWIKRGIGVIVLLAVVAIALGLDTKTLSKISYLSTNQLEEKLVSKLSPGQTAHGPMPMPPIDGANEWINSPPLTREDLKGKVVLVDFWTYSCINCIRTLPYLKAWNEKYGKDGFVLIGVHSPEFAFEKDIGNIKHAVEEFGIRYPVAVDNDQRIWTAFQNRYWPAHYLIDANGMIRYEDSGEGHYGETEKMIQSLLLERNPNDMLALEPVTLDASSSTSRPLEAPASGLEERSPETYLGYAQQRGFSSKPALVPDKEAKYTAPAELELHQWALNGNFKVDEERIVLRGKSGSLRYRFHARDLHLVLGIDGKAPVPFRVTLDGKEPGANHGADTDEHGNGQISGQRLYQLIRLKAGNETHTFEIEFLAPSAEGYAFTFG